MNEDLKIFTEIGSAFSDISIDMNNYDIATNQIALVKDSDYLYVSLYKKFKNIYVSIKELVSVADTAFEYWNGAAWVALTVMDQSKGLSQSGFIYWEMPEDWAQTEVFAHNNYYIRATYNGDVTFNGINMLFSNDADLKEHYRQINDYLGTDASYIALHQASRKDIIQRIRNSGKTKLSSIDCTLTDLTIWDFTRPDQLRNAAAYLCLSKIFGGVSDNADGKFMNLSSMFRKEYVNAVDTFLLNVDINDNGKEDRSEQSEAVNITRIVTL